MRPATLRAYGQDPCSRGQSPVDARGPAAKVGGRGTRVLRLRSRTSAASSTASPEEPEGNGLRSLDHPTVSSPFYYSCFID